MVFYWTSEDDFNFNWSGKTPVLYKNGSPTGTLKSSSLSGANRSATFTVLFPQTSNNDPKEDVWKIGVLEGGTLPVELSSYTAIHLGSNRVRLDWITESETGVNGFYIFRGSTELIQHANLVSPLIQATNTSNQTAYTFEDREVPGDGAYWYWLQNVDMDGTSDYH